jgi:hypothetical protein
MLVAYMYNANPAQYDTAHGTRNVVQRVEGRSTQLVNQRSKTRSGCHQQTELGG